jgi:hypothetical protein
MKTPMNGQFTDAVILLGAGASVDAQLPTAIELTRRLRVQIDDLGDAMLRRAFGLVVGGEAFRKGCAGEPFQEMIDIEMLLINASMLADKMSAPLAPYVAVWHWSVAQLDPHNDGTVFRRLIALGRALLGDELRVPNDNSQVKYLAEAVTSLQRALPKQKGRPAIYTLNYDLCVEQALRYTNVPFTTGFRDGKWDPTEFDDPEKVSIVKLHGSFGWVRHPETKLLYDRDAALKRDDVDFVSDTIDDELIFAIDHKLQGKQPFLWMAHDFAERIAAARYVVVIGYGFRDDYVNQIIGHAMAIDTRKQLIVVGPSAGRGFLDGKPNLPVYPERTHYIPSGAKRALQDDDAVRKKIEELVKSEVDPF